MKKNILSFIGGLLFVSHLVGAQTDTVHYKKWGVEAELVQSFIPTVQISRIQVTRALSGNDSKLKSDLIIGAYFRPNVNHDVVEKINEYMLAIGYRQFLWKGLHVEGKSNMGYAWGTKNLIDGKDYNTPTWFWEANVGYKFYLKKGNKVSLYLNPQFGALGKVVADIGPRGGKPDNFIHGNFFVGLNF
ncbi:MAG: hypothetical protein U0V72_14595 [Cytophagales bacterium]